MVPSDRFTFRKHSWNLFALSHEWHCVSPRGLLFALLVALLASVGVPLNAQLCTGTSPPCVLTNGYAGPATDPNFNSRQAINPYETTFTPTSVAGITTTGTLFEVDDSASALPTGATSNPIMPSRSMSRASRRRWGVAAAAIW